MIQNLAVLFGMALVMAATLAKLNMLMKSSLFGKRCTFTGMWLALGLAAYCLARIAVAVL